MSGGEKPARVFLFLQGPHGAFFPKLGAALVRAGHVVERVNFNGGDRATWPGGTSFHGSERGWPAFVAHYLDAHAVTDIVLFGDARPKHVAAIAEAHRAGIRVHVFEEGYIRPDWVTLERDGVNGRSRLPRDPDWYLTQAAGLPPVPTHAAIASYRSVRGWAAFFYYAEVVLQFWRFPLHRTHRVHDPVSEGISYLRAFRRRERTPATPTPIPAEYFLFPLQLDSDYQVRLHSPFADLPAAIRHVLESFARHATPTAHLVVKEHPLDSGLVDWRSVIAEVAAEYGIADRVHFRTGDDLLRLIRGARGVVTINSTSGTLALAEGVPTAVVGTAVYDIAGVCHAGALDGFWRDPQPPNPEVYEAFYRVLVDRCLFHGAFLSQSGIELMIARIVGSLTGA